jgi:hypothetical protein
MIDRFGDSTFSFTFEARTTLEGAHNLSGRLRHPTLSPRHVGTSLVLRYPRVFGDSVTAQGVMHSLIDWENRYGSAPDEMPAFLNMAAERASREKPIKDIDLFYALLTPDLQTPPVDPFAFVTGDELYPLVYREKVFARAGGETRNPHFNSPAYEVAQLELARAVRFHTTGRREFTHIPEKLLHQATETKKVS